MKEYFKTSLSYLVCLLSSWLAGALVHIVPTIVISLVTPPYGTIRELLTRLSLIIIVSVFLYISVYRIGYKRNIAYEKISMNKLSIPIIILPLFLMMIFLVANFLFSDSSTDEIVGGLIFMGLNFIPYSLVMFLGTIMGYKKREKDRKEMKSV